MNLLQTTDEMFTDAFVFSFFVFCGVHVLGMVIVGYIPVGVHLLKVNNRNTRTRCEICSKLTIKTPQRRRWRRYGVFIVNFEHI